MVLLLLNVVAHWPKPKNETLMSGERPPGPPPGEAGEPPAEMRERFEAALAQLPLEQRQQIQQRMEEDRTFFESVKSLPEAERHEKIQARFAENPPPRIPGMENMEPPQKDRPPGAPIVNSTDGNIPGTPGGRGSDSNETPGSKGPGGPGGNRVPDPVARKAMDRRIAQSQTSSQP